MKKLIILAIMVALIVMFVLPGALYAGPGHQRVASQLKGDTATVVPEHMIDDNFGNGHQSKAALLKWDVASLVPGHVIPW